MTDTATGRWGQYSDAGRRSLGQGQLAEAEQAFRAAVREAEQIGAESPQLATSLNALGQIRLQSKDLVEAEQLLTRALAIRERVYGAGHQALVPSLNNLGALYDAKGELDAAEASLARALTISEQQLGAEHPDVALALSNLAKLHFKRREFAKADRLLIRLLAIRRALGKDHPEVATVLGSLARLRQAVGKHDLAEQLWRQALAIRERAFAANDAIIATTLESIADCCVPQAGKFGEAVSLRERALAIRVERQGESHPMVANARAKLGELRARLQPDIELLPVDPPATRSSREVPTPLVSQEGPRFSGPTAAPPGDLPWISIEASPGAASPGPAADDTVSFALPGTTPSPVRPMRPTPGPQSAMRPTPLRPTPIRPSTVRQPSLRTTAQRPSVKPAPRRRKGRGVLRALALTVVLLGALGAGAWYARSRGLVTLPPQVEQPIERLVARLTAPTAEARAAEANAAPAATPPSAPDSAVQVAVTAAAKTRAAGKRAASGTRPARDTAPDDPLAPKVKVDLKKHAVRGAVEIDAITRAIDRAAKAKLDSVEKARLGVRPATRRP